MRGPPQLSARCLFILINFTAAAVNAVARDLTYIRSGHERRSPAGDVVQKVLTKYGGSSVIQIVDTANVLNDVLGKACFSSPVIIFRWTVTPEDWVASAYTKMDALYEMIERYRFEQASALKIRAATCLLTLVLGKAFVFRTGAGSGYVAQEALKLMLQQEVPFGVEFQSNIRKAPFVPFPQSLIVYDDHVKVDQVEMIQVLEDLHRKVLRESQHLPTILFLASCGNEHEPSCNTAWHICWYCDLRDSVVVVDPDFSNAIEGIETVASHWAEQTHWKTIQGWFYVSSCPFTLKASACTVEALTIETEISKATNVTFHTHLSPYSSPTVIVSRHAIDFVLHASKMEFVSRVETPVFGLISSDHVAVAGSWVGLRVLEPLTPLAWVGVGLGALAVSAAFTGIYWSSNAMSVKGVFHSLFTVTRVLVDQPAFVEDSSQLTIGGQSELVKRLIWACWLISVLIYTNGYKGIFKSSYVFEPTYGRNWSKLLDMEDFTIYFTSGQWWGIADNYPVVQAVKPCIHPEAFLGDGRHPCASVNRFLELLAAPIFEKTEELAVEFAKRNRLLENSRLVNMWSLPSFVALNLTMPRTAFATPAYALDSDWKTYFLPAVRQKGCKFARHLSRDDTTLQSTFWHGYTKALHSWQQKIVPRAFKTIVSSGRLVLWRKWEALRRERNYTLAERQDGSSSDEYYMPLSFNKSDVQIQFTILCVLLASATLAFMLEILHSVTNVKLRRLARTLGNAP